jgi:FkbM family methyltransferase
MIEIINNNRQILISDQHSLYLEEIKAGFDHYFDSVDCSTSAGISTVDFSSPGWHTVKGYNKHKIFFPFVAEPLATTQQYIDLLELTSGDTILDLGAYSGLASIMFKETVGKTGHVIAVEADPINHTACATNFAEYEKVTGLTIDLISAAVWNHSNGLAFTSDGSMGSAARELLHGKKTSMLVNSITIPDIAKRFNLEKVDCIKCDVEGAERVVFDDLQWFESFKPKLIIEVHQTVDAVAGIEKLKTIGYQFESHEQIGCEYPLMFGIYSSTL